MGEEKISSENFGELANLALESSVRIVEWVEYINENIHQQLLKYFRKNLITVAATPAPLPINSTCLISPLEEYKWGTRSSATSNMPETFSFTMIALYKPKDKKWRLEIGWSKFSNVKVKGKKKEGNTNIARHLLEIVNERRDKSGSADTDNATGNYEIFDGWKPLFEYDSREKIGELVQKISDSFIKIEA